MSENPDEDAVRMDPIDRGTPDERRDLSDHLRECIERTTAIHETAELLEDDRLEPTLVLRRVATLLLPAMRHADVACARARYGELVVATPGFQESRWRLSAPFRTRDGTAGALDVVYLEDRPLVDDGPFLDEERKLIQSIAELTSAILDRRVSDIALEHSAQRLKLAQSAAGMGAWEWDAATGAITLSEELEDIAGLHRGAFPGTFAFLASMIHHEDRAAVESAIRAARSGAAHGGGDVLEVEFRLMRPDGKQRWVAATGRVTREDGRAVRMLGMAHDVTGLRQLEQAFRASQKMEALGRLAGGVAHDFNNLITAIRGYSELAMEGLAADDQRRTDVQEIVAAADRAAGLTRQLLAFSRQQILEPRVIDPNELVAGMQGLLGRLLGADIDLEVVLGSRTPHIRIDPGQFEQVILNLVVNARDAMPRGGRLSIETGVAEFGERVTWTRVDLPAGRYAMLVVSDTGAGMSEETREQIFEPFFTTKPTGEGTGLGLATVYGIVQQSGGAVWVYSEPGRGSTFKVYLPGVEADVDADAAPAASVLPVGGTERILVVDDDQQVKMLVERTLRARGYAVSSAAKGTDALDVVRAASEPFDLLVTDVVMPGLQGPELAQRVLELAPNTRVLFMTGYTDRTADASLLRRGERILSKPFAASELLRMVRECLDHTAPSPSVAAQIDVAFDAITEILRARVDLRSAEPRLRLPLQRASERAAFGGLSRDETLGRVRAVFSLVRAESDEERALCQELIDYTMECYQRARDEIDVRGAGSSG